MKVTEFFKLSMSSRITFSSWLSIVRILRVSNMTSICEFITSLITARKPSSVIGRFDTFGRDCSAGLFLVRTFMFVLKREGVSSLFLLPLVQEWQVYWDSSHVRSNPNHLWWETLSQTLHCRDLPPVFFKAQQPQVTIGSVMFSIEQLYRTIWKLWKRTAIKTRVHPLLFNQYDF